MSNIANRFSLYVEALYSFRNDGNPKEANKLYDEMMSFVGELYYNNEIEELGSLLISDNEDVVFESACALLCVDNQIAISKLEEFSSQKRSLRSFTARQVLKQYNSGILNFWYLECK